MVDYLKMFETCFNTFPGFDVEIQGVYKEIDASGRIGFYTYVVARVIGADERNSEFRVQMTNCRCLVRPSRDERCRGDAGDLPPPHPCAGRASDVDEPARPNRTICSDRRKNLRNHRLPHLVATCGGEVVGYAYVVLFRKRPAYRYAVKHSIYVHHEHLGRGVGRLLLQELIDACAAAGFRQMIGYIDADNAPSLALHEKFGFAQRRPAPRRRLSIRPLGRHRHGATLSRRRFTEPPLFSNFGR